jgi:hypothetical protein
MQKEMLGSPRGYEGSSLELFLLPKGLIIIMGMKIKIKIKIIFLFFIFLNELESVSLKEN